MMLEGTVAEYLSHMQNTHIFEFPIPKEKHDSGIYFLIYVEVEPDICCDRGNQDYTFILTSLFRDCSLNHPYIYTHIYIYIYIYIYTYINIYI